MQVQHHARPLRAGGRERAPAKQRAQIVGVHHPCAADPHGLGDIARREAAAQEPCRRARFAEASRVARQQLRGLPQTLAHERQQLLHHALLAAGRAIAVV
jgi:hypothetical protein